MHKELRPEQIDILVGTPAVNDEFSRKVKELDRRLQANGMSYSDWETLNDRQHDIFADNLFLDGECATSVDDYVMGAVDSCWCPDVIDDLHHHSPVLMREIEKQQDMLPDMKVKIGESLNNLNKTIDLLLENIILSEQEDKSLGDEKTALADINEMYLAYHLNGDSFEGIFPEDVNMTEQIEMRKRQLAEFFGSPEEAQPYIDAQIARAKPMAGQVMDYLKAGKYPSIEEVAWTARPNSLSDFIGEKADQSKNPSDVVVKFSADWKGWQQGTDPSGKRFLGISAKSTKQQKGDIAFANRGSTLFTGPTKPEEQAASTEADWLMYNYGGQEVKDFLEEEKTRLKDKMYETVRLVLSLQTFPEEDESGQQYMDELYNIAPALTRLEKDAKGRLTDAAIKRFFRGLEKTAEDIAEREHLAAGLPAQDFKRQGRLKGYESFQAQELGDLYQQLAALMQDSSRRLQELYRLQAIELYKKLGKENLRDHLLAYWVRQEGLALRPPWILVTGRGSGQNLKATISQMSEKVNKINSADKFFVSKVGNDSVGIGFIDSQGNKVPFVKLRMKVAGGPFSSLKPTGEQWKVKDPSEIETVFVQG